MYYVDLLVKEYEDSIDSKRNSSGWLWLTAVALIISLVVFLTFVAEWYKNLPILKNCSESLAAIFSIIAVVVVVFCAFMVRFFASKTEVQRTETQLREGQMEEEQSEGTITITGGNVTTTDRIAVVPPMESSIGTPMTNIGKREEVLQKFFQNHNLDTKDNAEIQELIDCIETRAKELECVQPLSKGFKRFISSYIIPIAISVISIIAKGLESADLIVGGISLIVTLFVWFVAMSAINKVWDEIFNRPTKQYHEMAQDIKLYNILRSDTPATSNESQT